MCAAQNSHVLVQPSRWAAITGSVAMIVIVLDRISKMWIESRFEPGPCIEPDDCIDIIGSLRIHYIENPGMAFSQGENVGPILGVVAIIMSLVLIRIASKSVSPLRQGLIGLVLGGALGNLFDRILRADDGLLSGKVIDFVDLQWFPIWNVADAAITCGVLGLLLVGSKGEPAIDDRAADETPSSCDAEVA